ncbi:HlyC/CorC family transporter [Chryseobacterium sp. L7]|uniref:HlyC/CorC family transporter n=1 Tax=Chryseobacterium endalhagicum TaxID=2797638 RepID=A0ABS1QD16_9FLAO|nr:hemolysin family protein [Chryseobacterium endalhagicum]MBL1220506.1 HlyC/CorC family transporter [Chryseobacterium endalhagicum]
MEIIIIIVLILLNGIFSMSEMALVSSKTFRLKSEKKKGSSRAKTALKLAEDPSRFLSTVQIGITLIGILLGIFSGDRLTTDLTLYISKFEFFNEYARGIAAFIIVAVITFLSIVFGELIPKKLGLKFPEKTAIIIAKPMYWMSVLASPFVWLLTVTNEAILKLFGIRDDEKEMITEEEIKSIIKEGKEGGVIEEQEHDVLRNAFELGDRRVSSLATHRSKIISLDADDSYEMVKEKLKNSTFSTYPVTDRNNLDHIIGMVKMRDLFDLDHESFNLREHLRKAVFVTENSFIYPLMESFKTNRVHLAVVIDEYGTTKGIITLNDILDDLVGNIPDGAGGEKDIIRRNENSWLVEGKCPLYHFKKYFQIELDEKIEKNFVSVSGLFIFGKDTVPQTGDQISIEDLTLEIVDKDGNRIDKILVTRKDGEE